jgi:hypothetical protein
MTYHVHSAQALEARAADDTSTRWHRLHKEMKDLYTEVYPQLRTAIRDGSNYPLTHRLTYYASNFGSITPLNQAVVLGFYDSPDTETSTVYIPSFINRTTRPCLLNDTVQVNQAAPLRRSGSGQALTVEAGTSGRQRRIRRSSSILSSSTVGEGSGSRISELPLRRSSSILSSSTVGEGSGSRISGLPLRRSSSILSSSTVGEGSGSWNRGVTSLRRSLSIQSSSTVGEGSRSRKRGLTPPEGGVVTNKRARTSEASKAVARETRREETEPSGEPRRNPARGKHRQKSGHFVSLDHSRSFVGVV